MAFTSEDDLLTALIARQSNLSIWLKANPNLAGVANTWQSMWTFPGEPQAGGFTGSALAAAQCTSSTTGGIYIGTTPVSPLIRRLLKWSLQCGIAVSNVQPMTAILYDRLLYYPGIDMTTSTEQTLTNPVALPRYTDGLGVRAWLEVTTGLGTNAATCSYRYIDQNGDSNLSSGTTITVSTGASKIPHVGASATNFTNSFLPFNGTDTGMQRCTSFQLTAGLTAGVCALVMGYPLAVITIPDTNTLIERQFVYGFPSQPRIYDDACLGILFCPTGAASALAPYMGDLEVAYG
jgi:hypothetical protein